MFKNKLIIGSANVNQTYGLKKNIVKTKDFKSILDLALRNGIDFIDTSPAYGQSEKIIGSLKKNFNIITKIPKIPMNVNLGQVNNWVTNRINNSMRKLKKKKIFGILIQNAEILLKPKGKIIIDSLESFKNEGIIKKIGVSIYDFRTLEKILDNQIKFDFVQVPYNIFDRRFKNQQLLTKLKKRKIQVHARSIFLQGLLVQDNITLPKKLIKLEKALNKWNLWLNKKKINPIHACLDFVLQNKNIDKIVVGVNHKDNLKDILKFKKVNNNLSKFNLKINRNLLDPRVW